MTERFDGVRTVVVGAGVAGASAARVMLDLGADVLVTDERDSLSLNGVAQALAGAGVTIKVGGHDPSDLDGAELVIVSPGVTPDGKIPTWARERGVPIWGELELGARIASAPYLAVTGTNGKTTTTGMIAACLRAGGADVVACGNIGRPFPAAAAEGHEALVVEASSFQLATQTSFHPVVSVLLNVAEDHIDWHGSLGAYRDAKGKVFAAQSSPDTHVGNRDDPVAAEISAGAPCDLVWIRGSAPGDGEVGYIAGELTSRLQREAVPLGRFNPGRAGYLEDAAAAAAAALSFGVGAADVVEGLFSYRPEGHRGDVVAERDGLRFVDNSKATNVHAVLAAVAAVEGPLVLIAGGRAKGQDLTPLRAVAGRLSAVIAIGEDAEQVVRAVSGGTETIVATSMDEAVHAAIARCPRPGTVLLAPACASWDMYTDYAERGREFARCALMVEETPHA